MFSSNVEERRVILEKKREANRLKTIFVSYINTNLQLDWKYMKTKDTEKLKGKGIATDLNYGEINRRKKDGNGKP